MYYQHYKGGKYELICLGRDVDTQEEKAVFRNLATEQVWIRPWTEFCGTVEVDGKMVDRFKLVDDTHGSQA